MGKFDNYKVFCGNDFSQMEIRVLGHMANDKALLEIFAKKIDIHAAVGADLAGRDVEEIMNDEDARAEMKALHFALVYGKKPPGILADIIADYIRRGKKPPKDLTLEKVERFYNKYFSKYKGVKKLIQYLISFADENEYAENIFGFRREIPKESETHGFWQNRAVNTPVQGGAHQILLIALAILYLKPKRYWTFEELIMEVHDALYSIVKVKDLPEHYRQGQHLLQEETPQYIEKWFGFKLRVPLVADCKAGFRMGVMVKYKGGPVDEFIDSWREENKKVEERVQATLKKYKSN